MDNSNNDVDRGTPIVQQLDTQLNTVMKRMAFLLCTGEFSDVSITVGQDDSQKSYKVHRPMLCAASKVFTKLLSDPPPEFSETRTWTVAIDDVHPEGFQTALEFLYTDHVELKSVDQVIRTAIVAHKFELIDLQRHCSSFLSIHLLPQNACQIWEFSKDFGEQSLLKRCVLTFQESTEEVIQAETFVKTQPGTVQAILQEDTLKVSSELVLFNAVQRWAVEECKRSGDDPSVPSQLRKTMDPMLPAIRFLAMTSKEFSEGPARSGVITTEECFCIFMNIADMNSKEMPEWVSTKPARIPPPQYVPQSPLPKTPTGQRFGAKFFLSS